ncbi:MAG: hypothetical protein ACI4HI_00905 [Lachnospiraceae bacterium]
MKKRYRKWCLLLCVAGGLTVCPLTTAKAEEHGNAVLTASAETEEQVAKPEEKAARTEVGSEDMQAVMGAELKDGTYDMEVESDSSMFRIVNASLKVEAGKMQAVLTLGGKGYAKLFMGTGEQAVKADESKTAPYVEDADGAYTYTVSVEALNQPLDCAAFSKRKEKWYDHKIVFDADSLPKEAFEKNLPDLADGTYQVEVTLTGGSGRASITSPAKLTVKDQKLTAEIIWSSPNYDYMKIGNTVYQPVQKEGNATFEIPVVAFDKEIAVIADTTAMSEPHEISYTLNFASDSIQGQSSQGRLIAIVIAILLLSVCGTVLGAIFCRKRIQKRKKSEE